MLFLLNLLTLCSLIMCDQICYLKPYDRCYTSPYELVNHGSDLKIGLCCTDTPEDGKKFQEYGIKSKWQLINDEIIPNNVNYNKKIYDDFDLILTNYPVKCYRTPKNLCICISLTGLKTESLNCEIAFPMKFCLGDDCNELEMLEMNLIGYKMQRKGRSGTIYNHIIDVQSSTNCNENKCYFKDYLKHINNVTGLIVRNSYKFVESIKLDYMSIIWKNLMSVILFIVWTSLYRRTPRFEILKCQSCCGTVIRGIHHNCNVSDRVVLEENVRGFYKRKVVMMLIIILAMIVNVESNCDDICNVMNSENIKNTVQMKVYSSNMEVVINVNKLDYNYGIKEIEWESEYSKACDIYNKPREWTYDRENTTKGCKGKANYADQGNIVFNSNDKFDIELMGKVCFLTPGSKNILCLDIDENYDTKSMICSINKTDLSLIKKLLKDDLITRFKENPNFVLVNDYISHPESLEKPCSYIRESQPTVYSSKFNAFEHSKFCSKGERLHDGNIRTNMKLIKVNDGYKIKTGEMVRPKGSCVLKEIDDCRFGIVADPIFPLKIKPYCKGNFILSINGTKKVMPCFDDHIPLMFENTIYDICGYKSKGFNPNKTFVCDCQGTVQFKELVLTSEKVNIVKDIHSLLIIKYIKLTIMIMFSMWIYFCIIVDNVNNKVLRREIYSLDKGINNHYKSKSMKEIMKEGKKRSRRVLIEANNVKTKMQNRIAKLLHMGNKNVIFELNDLQDETHSEPIYEDIDDFTDDEEIYSRYSNEGMISVKKYYNSKEQIYNETVEPLIEQR